jgi:hypothetical protein
MPACQKQRRKVWHRERYRKTKQLLRAVYPVHKGGNDSQLAKSKHSLGKIGKGTMLTRTTQPTRASAPEARAKRLRTAGKTASIRCHDADEAFAVKILEKYWR